MKSLKERLEDKRIRQEKEEMKLTNRIQTFTFRLPWNGYPYCSSKGDRKYLMDKATALVNLIWRNCGPEFKQFLKDAYDAKWKEQTERNARRNGLWSAQPTLQQDAAGNTAPFVSVRLNPNGTLTDGNGTVYSPNTTYPNPPIPTPETPGPIIQTRDVSDVIATENLCVDDNFTLSPEHLERFANTSLNEENFGRIIFTGPTAEPSIHHVDHIVPTGWRLQEEPAMTNEAAQRAFTQAEVERIQQLSQTLTEIQNELTTMGVPEASAIAQTPTSEPPVNT